MNSIDPAARRAGATPHAPARTGRLAVLDGLRISAALMVAVYHYTSHETAMKTVWGAPREVAFPGVSDVFKYGFLGVELFFMISGFVICMSSWGRSAGRFAQSRVVRLFPAYWPAVLLTAAVLWLSPLRWPAPAPDELLMNLTMLNAPAGVPHVDAVYWTLWAELRFYLLFGVALLWRGLTLQRTMIFGFAWLVLAVTFSRAGLPVLNVVLQPDYAPFFTAGIALFLIHRFGPDIRLWGLLGLSFATAEHSVAVRAHTRHLNSVTAMVVVAIFFAVLTAIATGWSAQVRWRWLTTAGALTYPFYLLHEYIGWTFIHRVHDLAPRYVVLTVTLAGMLVASWLLHRFVEKPLAGVLKTQLAEASRKRTVTMSGSSAPAARVPDRVATATVEVPVYRA